MRSVLVVLVLCLVGLVFAQGDDNYFCVNFFKEPNYKTDEGVSCRELAPGTGAGSPRGNMHVRSLQAPDFIEVTLFDNYYYKGKSVTYKGNQEDIPEFTVHSVKYKNTKTA
ncbi:hypothetical protein BC940DRAFT_331959 [Gongronella butleri]|nr:hypothetical protein BC940DRAFT_331959 [Gongronella butleri]